MFSAHWGCCYDPLCCVGQVFAPRPHNSLPLRLFLFFFVSCCWSAEILLFFSLRVAGSRKVCLCVIYKQEEEVCVCFR